VNRIILEPESVAADGRTTLSGRAAAHVLGVLRAGPGRRLRVGLLNGPAGMADVEHADAAAGEVVLTCAFDAGPPPRPRVDLALALPRPKVLKRLWPALAALGVGRIWILNAARVERVYFDTHVLDPAFIRARLIEGLEQSGDTRLPEVTVHRRLRPWVEDLVPALDPAPAAMRLLDPGGGGRLSASLSGLPPEGRLLLAVGPEGGWVEYERALFLDHGFTPAHLGPRVLRSDTACLAALAIAHDAIDHAAR
jgi:16S rRNA (uracil1498-N3)-methyltransferase